ncbi:MAG: nuclear transport factor 2 family protein [Pyrinomonadaceae bacterium]
MTESTAEKFIAALHKLEESRETEEIVALYADNAEIANVVAPLKFAGQDGARDFWTKYRDTFGEMRSEFRNKIYGENSAALEWTTTGKSSNDHEVCYSGVTILEIENDKITRSCAYFNADDLGRQIEKGAPPKQNQAVSA